MSIYLGQDPIGVSYLTKANMYEDSRSVMQDYIYTPWVRPEDWPDLDSLNLEMSGTESFIYMTFKTGYTGAVFSCEWTLVSGQSITIDEGYIENGEFISIPGALTTFTSNSSATFVLDSTNGYNEEGFTVFKITGRFSRFSLRDYTRPSANGGGTIKYYMQPMLERIWYIPELARFYNGSSTSTTGNGTITLERDKINNGNGNALTNMSNAWCYSYKLQSLDITGLKTQNVTNMTATFQYCKLLEILDVSNFNTANVTTMTQMFQYCQRIKELDLRTWNTNKLVNAGLTSIFSYCYALREILGLENFYTSNLNNLNSVFLACYTLENLYGVTNWDVSNVTNFSNLFAQCYKIKTLDLSNWNVSKVTTLYQMFSSCISLERIKYPMVKTSILSGSQYGIFQSCYNLQEIDLSWLGEVTSAVTSIGFMFQNCRSIKELNIPEGWNITGCTTSDSCRGMFAQCYKLQRITGISNWDMSNYNYSLNYLFQSDYNLKQLDIKNWCPHPTGLAQTFESCCSLEEIDLTGWHWENMTGTGISSLFSNCNSLKTIKGIEHMGDSGNLTSFSGIFNGCYSLTSIPNINSWNPSKVTTCADMFNSCRSLKSLTITNWSLPKCTSISNMFRYCYNLEELELTGWTLSALTTNPDYIFNQLWSLKKCSGLPIQLNHRYQEAFSLPENQWVRIFTQLPTVSNKTLYISSTNINRLSTETKAIATNKGWTLAN